ncbi:S8 family serine peptidase, partial [Planctomycetota bacterium]
MRKSCAAYLILAGALLVAPAAAKDVFLSSHPADGTIGPLRSPPEHVHDQGHSDCCGLEPAIALARMELALKARPGKTHPVTLVKLPGRPPHPAVMGQVLISLRAGAALEELLERHTLTVATSLAAHRVYALERTGTRPEQLVAALADDRAVEHATANWVARTLVTPNDQHFYAQDACQDLQLEAAWDIARGSGVTVAVLDTGIDAGHPDLQGVLATNGWHDVVNAAAQPMDDNGHGTAMTGVLAARFNNQLGIAGVAPEARILAIKVADRDGQASFADLIAGMDEAVRRRAPIVCMSLGAYVEDPLLEQAVARSVQAGTLLVAAAGNENLNSPTWPAAYDGVVAVGGAGPGPSIAFRTVLAPSLAVLAPAETVLTTLPGGIYGFVGGTSAASACAAGVAALALSRSPGFGPLELAQVLRHGCEPVGAIRLHPETFPVGGLDGLKAVERAVPGYVDVAVIGHRVQPEIPVPARPATIRALVRNEGNQQIASLIAKARFQYLGTFIEIQPLVVSALGVGETREVEFRWSQPPPAGLYTVEVRVDPLAGETEILDNHSRSTIQVQAGARRGSSIIRLETTTDHRSREVEVAAVLANVGTQDESGVVVTFHAGSAVFATRQIAVAEGGTAALSARWPFPATPPNTVAFWAKVAPLPGETNLQDNGARSDVRIGLGSARPLHAFYQQSNGVDLIADAPFRVGPSRTYVPIQVFCASKADSDTNTYLTFRSVEVSAKDDPQPGSPSTTIYEDATGTPPSVAAAGLEMIDEMGQVLPSLDIFSDQRLHQHGRHTILKVPKAALGIAQVPGQPLQKYFDIRMAWKFHRRILYFFTCTRNGTHKKVLGVTFGSDDLPRLPGDNHYYDVHNHTIAEWFFDHWLSLFAPRKAYGGPLVMVNESAAALGMISDPQNVRDLVAITDHNVFYNKTVGDPNAPYQRPPYGPSSPAASVGPTGQIVPEGERYRELYGVSAGEEAHVA